MKKFTLLLTALLMLSLSVMAQIKMYLHFNDGTRVEYIASRVDSITFDPQIQEPDDSETPDSPIIPDDEDPTDKEDDPVKPDDKEEKSFSVSETKTVTFSPGNLQYHPANDEWRFAPNQTDYIGGDNENISSTYNGWIDLFGWGTGNNPTNAVIDYYEYQTFVDWGVNKIGDYKPNTWRTLTKDEWEYIISGRANATNLMGVAEVEGVNGLILLPDNWTCPSGVTFKSGTYDGDRCIACFGYYQKIGASEWEKLEASGVVFLPISGARFESTILNMLDYGAYWAATDIDPGTAYDFFFSSSRVTIANNIRYYGQSVRLVRESNNNTDNEDADDDKPVKPDEGEDSSVNANGHEYVDLGLPSGTLWATMNVGAESPEDYGDYFAWGETEPKDYYFWNTYKLMTDGMSSLNGVNKYTSPDGQTSAVWYNEYGEFIGDNKTVLERADDAANANWGGDWVMPTKEEQEELREECSWTWEQKNGVNGYTVIGPNGNSIFLPAAGCSGYVGLGDAGSHGYYYSSSLNTDGSNYAYGLYFYSGYVGWYYNGRFYGQSVRPVLRVE